MIDSKSKKKYKSIIVEIENKIEIYIQIYVDLVKIRLK